MLKVVVVFSVCTVTLLASIGSVSAIRGDVKITRGIALYQAHLNLEVDEKDTFFTGRRGTMQITFNDNTVITLGRNTVFKVEEYLYSEQKKGSKAKFKFQKGYFKSITGRIGKLAPKHFAIKTKNSTIGVRGTEIIGNSGDTKEDIICTNGEIVVRQGKKEVVAKANEKIEIKLDPRVKYTVASAVDVMVQKQVTLGIKKADDPEVVNRPKASITKSIKKAYKAVLKKQGVSVKTILETPTDDFKAVERVDDKTIKTLEKEGFKTDTKEFKTQVELRKEVEVFTQTIKDTNTSIAPDLVQPKEEEQTTTPSTTDKTPKKNKQTKVTKKYPKMAYEPIPPETIGSVKPFAPNAVTNKDIKHINRAQHQFNTQDTLSNMSRLLNLN